MKDRMNEELRQKRRKHTTVRKTFIERQGYNVVEMWECDFKELMYSDPDIQSSSILPPFTRSNPHEVDEDEITCGIKAASTQNRCDHRPNL